jgi:SAM-dependent methyltransferase
MRARAGLLTVPPVRWAPLPVQRVERERAIPYFPLASRRPVRDVPFVPTPQEVVDDMLRAARLRETDVLFDLGCGDGRIVITAARSFGVRGIGIDIDPERIKSCEKNAIDAGVEGRVRFEQQSLFAADLREATVVTLYLLPWVNLGLRSKLLKELRPGSRIISHAFSMKEWLPDRMLRGMNGKTVLYCWTIPANVQGRWNCTLRLDDGRCREAVLEFEQEYQTVIGTCRAMGRDMTLERVRLVGPELCFTLPEHRPGTSPVTYQCRVEDGTLRGSGRPAEGRVMELGLRARRSI